MGYFNIKLDDSHTEKFKELKTFLKLKTNDETFEKIIDLSLLYLEQQLLHHRNPSPTTDKREDINSSSKKL